MEPDNTLQKTVGDEVGGKHWKMQQRPQRKDDRDGRSEAGNEGS